MPSSSYDPNQHGVYQQTPIYNIQPFEPQIIPNFCPATTEYNINEPSSVLSSLSNILNFGGREDISEPELVRIQNSDQAAASTIPLFPCVQSSFSSSSISSGLPLPPVQPSVFSKQQSQLVAGE